MSESGRRRRAEYCWQMARLVKEQQRGRRLARHARQDLESEVGSRSAGSNRKRRARPAAGFVLSLVVPSSAWSRTTTATARSGTQTPRPRTAMSRSARHAGRDPIGSPTRTSAGVLARQALSRLMGRTLLLVQSRLTSSAMVHQVSRPASSSAWITSTASAGVRHWRARGRTLRSCSGERCDVGCRSHRADVVGDPGGPVELRARAHARSGDPSRSPATSAPPRSSTAQSRPLPSPMPIRTSATTPRSSMP